MRTLFTHGRTKYRTTALLILFTMLTTNMLSASETSKTGYVNVSAIEALHLTNTLQNVVILDVRDHPEFELGHLSGARSVPLTDLISGAGLPDRSMTLVVYSLKGERSAQACEILWDLGFKQLFNLKNGIVEWQAQGFPVISDDQNSSGRRLPPEEGNLKSQKSTTADEYCYSSGGSHDYEFIQNVSYSELSGGALSVTVIIYITNPNNCQYGSPCPSYDESPEYINAWIDWNGDNIFEESERVLNAALTGYLGINYLGSMSTSNIVSIPENAVGTTWMRVNLGWDYDPNDPCDISWTWGDVVDTQVEISVKPPSIKEIQVTGIPHSDTPIANDPSLSGSEKVKLEAVLENTNGYEITDIKWTGDLQAGEGNPYEYIPASGNHGKKKVICNISYKHLISGKTGTANLSRSFKLFFNKSGDDNNNNEPNWFEYWKRDGAVPGMSAANYDAAASGYGYMTHAGVMYLAPKASGQHYSSPIVLNTHFGEESFGGPTVKGIDCAAEVVAHESYHNWVTNQWKEGGEFNGKADSDKGVQADDCNDRLPDTYETGTSHTTNDDTDTYDLEHKKHSSYRRYGDEEYMAMRAGDNARGTPEKDWAFPGKQTNPAYDLEAPAKKATAAYEPVYAAFTGNYSDEGVDQNNDGSFEYLRINAGINVTSGGEINIVGILNDISLNEVALFNEPIVLESGIQSVDIDFNGLVIQEYGVDGPFSVTLLMTNEFGDSMDYKYDVHTTSAYMAGDFKHKQAYFLNQYSDYGSDVDSDGYYDSLVINIGLDVKSTGNYLLEGGLYDDSENVIELKTRTVSLSEGIDTLSISFDGLNINKKRINGPYHLRFLGISGEESGDFIYDAYTTSIYDYGDFMSPHALYSGTFNDYGTDLDGDTRYDHMTIEFEIETQEPGDYITIGYLYDANDDLVLAANLEHTLVAGSNQVAMEFDGVSLYKHGIDGPYLLKHLSLLDTNGILLDLVDNADTTAAYLFTDFQKPPVPLIALSGKYDAYKYDVDTNCVNDFLSVNAEISLSDSGFVIIKAQLEDSYGEEIVWAENIVFFNEDSIQTIRLDFDGSVIYSHAVDGPYVVKNVYIYHTGDPTQPDYVANAFITKPFYYIEFDTVPGYETNLMETVCEGQGFPVGDSLFTETGTYTVAMTSLSGCDSIVILDLLVNQADQINLAESICEGGSFQVGDTVYTETGTYSHAYTNQFGCDSLIILDLTVNNNPSVFLGNDTVIASTETLLLDAGADFVSYAWSTGETTRTIQIDSTHGLGTQAWQVTVTDGNNCAGGDTILITIQNTTNEASVTETDGLLKLYPNPTNGQLYIELENLEVNTQIQIFSETGQLLYSKQYESKSINLIEQLDISGYPAGTYIIKVLNNGRFQATGHFIKN